MPRKKPIQNPVNVRKLPPDIKFEKDYSYSLTTPCSNYKCDGFMFVVTVKYADHGTAFDELECFTCRRTKKLGHHQPHRNHVFLEKKRKFK